MDSNYEWQKHQANERIQQRLQEAQAHRQAKEANGQNRLASGWTLSILLGVGIIVVVWLLAGCTPISQISAAARVDVFAPRPEVVAVQDLTPRVWSMAERIRFQDRREAYLDWHTPMESIMAERIRFQDRREAYLDWHTPTSSLPK